jgi:hypothetical protein
MIIAFLLVVVVNDEVISDDRMLFESIYRCNEFAIAIEEGRASSSQIKRYRMQENVSAYCIPKMVPRGTELFE